MYHLLNKLIRITTIPLSLDKLLGEQLRFMNEHFEVTAVSANEVALARVAKKYGVKHFHKVNRGKPTTIVNQCHCEFDKFL